MLEQTVSDNELKNVYVVFRTLCVNT